MTTYVERALFLVGDQNTGKSTQLRSMFLDWRLGKRGEVPLASNVPNSYPLSNERCLYLRLSSPHEAGEAIEAFLDKCAREMQSGAGGWRRWNFASAVQISATPDLPEGNEIIRAFIKRFTPERVRAVLLTPDRSGNHLDPDGLRKLVADLRSLANCEVIMVDATSREANGLMYADFFDFT